MRMVHEKIKQLVSVAGIVVLSGCMSTSSSMLAETDYGPPPPDNYKAVIEEALGPSFVEKALLGVRHPAYEYRAPVKGHTNTHWLAGVRKTYGWVVCGYAYESQRLASYATEAGPVPFFVIFREGQIAEKLVGHNTHDDVVPPRRLNDIVRKVCKGDDTQG